MDKDKLNKFITYLRSEKIRFITVESITGGKFASIITSYPGISPSFKLGIVSYSNEAKMKLLNIDEKILDCEGAVSKETAKAMIDGALNILPADLVISFTGNAGPMCIEQKKLGMSYIGIYYKGEYFMRQFTAENKKRTPIIVETVDFAISEILKIVGII